MQRLLLLIGNVSWKNALPRHYHDIVSQGLNAAHHGAQTSFAASTASCARSAPPARVRLITTRNSSSGSFPSATSSRSPITSAGVLPRKSRAWSSPLYQGEKKNETKNIYTHTQTCVTSTGEENQMRCDYGRLQELCRNKGRWVGETRERQKQVEGFQP